MHKIHISAEFAVSDDQREHARFIAGLDEATAVYEAAIKEVTGQSVKLDIGTRRHKDVGGKSGETKKLSVAAE